MAVDSEERVRRLLFHSSKLLTQDILSVHDKSSELTSTTNLQDTVLGLEALAAFAALIAAPVEGGGIVVSLSYEDGDHSFNPITQNNTLLLQSFKVLNVCWYIFLKILLSL